jgi:hypothetical protein
MRRLAMLLLVVLLLPARADALTLAQLVELHKAGLGDDVLVALIEVNKHIYTLEAATLKALKADGLSDRVLIAIINSGRQHLPPPMPMAVSAPEPAPAPTVVVIEHQAPAPQVIVQQVPVYVPVAVPHGRSRSVHVERAVTPPSPFYVGQVREPERRKAPEPEYWGFGGTLRPDAWGQKESTKEEVGSTKREKRR